MHITNIVYLFNESHMMQNMNCFFIQDFFLRMGIYFSGRNTKANRLVTKEMKSYKASKLKQFHLALYIVT